MAITQVQKKQAANQTASPVVVTLNSAPTQNNLLVSVISWAATAGTIGQPSGWTYVTGTPIDSAGAVGSPPTSGKRLTAVAYKVAGASESSTVSWTTTNVVNADMIAFEYSGLATSSPEDQHVTNWSASAAGSLSLGTTGTTTVAAELAIAFCGPGARAGQSLDNSFNLENSQSSRIEVGTKILAATGTVTCTASWTGTTDVAGGIVTFKGLTVTANPGQFFAML